MQTTRVGDFEVQRITEFRGVHSSRGFLPDFDPEVLRANPDMAGPRLTRRPASSSSAFCFIVKTGHHTILIDSCLGNDKERPTRPQFHRLRTPSRPISQTQASRPRRSTTDVHPPALGSCRLEHRLKTGAGSRPSQCALHHGLPRVRALARGKQGRGIPHRLVRGQRAAGRASGTICAGDDDYAFETAYGSKAPRAYARQRRDPRPLATTAPYSWAMCSITSSSWQAGMVDARLYRSHLAGRARACRRAGERGTACSRALPGADGRTGRRHGSGLPLCVQ